LSEEAADVPTSDKKKRRSGAHLRMLFLDDLPFLTNAACKDIRLPLWDLALDVETRNERAARHHNAKAICQDCPVRRNCRAWAETHEMTTRVTGVWGGKVFAPEWYHYPRCEICDVALALSRHAIRNISTGHRPASDISDTICSACARAYNLTSAEVSTTVADESTVESEQPILTLVTSESSETDTDSSPIAALEPFGSISC